MSYELATYPEGWDRAGPGQVVRHGSLSSLNATGSFQFHDLAAVGELTPGSDFFVWQNPPGETVQLRLLDESGANIAWNMIVGCA
jgi:hypothetical protein